MIAELSFSESIWLALLQAVFTSVLVAGAAALVVQWARSRSEESLQKRELASNEATKQRELASLEAIKERELLLAADAARREVRSDLIRQASRLGGTIYVITQAHWRSDNEEGALISGYEDWAIDSQVLENELVFRYGEDAEPVRMWHQARDLMTVRYFDLRQLNTLGLREANAETAENLHSGLTASELRDMKLVLQTYHEAMRSLVDAIQTTEIKI